MLLFQLVGGGPAVAGDTGAMGGLGGLGDIFGVSQSSYYVPAQEVGLLCLAFKP